MGFRDRCWSCLELCISIVGLSVLANGTAAGFYGSSRGLRQGSTVASPRFDGNGNFQQIHVKSRTAKLHKKVRGGVETREKHVSLTFTFFG